nr:PREDICTED: uncharacterized protein LOC102351306 [Latimeria chalumnae]|eukprot:XP_014339521.1 PREDICTED: uncharacterized protein LOC102351306 [Latimeria chalumnae]
MGFFNNVYENFSQDIKEKIFDWAKNCVVKQILGCSTGRQAHRGKDNTGGQACNGKEGTGRQACSGKKGMRGQASSGEEGMGCQGSSSEEGTEGQASSDKNSTGGQASSSEDDAGGQASSSEEGMVRHGSSSEEGMLCNYTENPLFPMISRNWFKLSQLQGKMLITKIKEHCLNFSQEDAVSRLGVLSCYFDNFPALSPMQIEQLMMQLDHCRNWKAQKLREDILHKFILNKGNMSEILSSVASMNKTIPKSLLRNLSNSDVFNFVHCLGQMQDWSPAEAKNLVKMYISGGGKVLTAAKLQQLGTLVKGLPCDIIQNISGSELLAALGQGLEKKFKHFYLAQRKTIIENIITKTNRPFVITSIPGYLVTEIPLQMIIAAKIKRVNEIENKELNQGQALHVLTSIFKDKSIQPAELRKLGSAFRGLTCDIINPIRDEDMLESAQIIEEHQQHVSRTQFCCAARKLFTALNKTRTNFFRNISETELSNLPPCFLLYLEPKTILELPPSVNQAFLQKISNMDLMLLARTSETRLAIRDKALKCLFNKKLPVS